VTEPVGFTSVPVSSRQPVTESENPAGLSDAVRAELETVLNNSAFRRSERHSRFLRFVCETALEGESSRLSEYLIAHAVFDRGPDYSPAEDSIVRRQAHSLRQRLHDYYSAEGKNDAVRIELPIGRYVPVFTMASPAGIPPVDPPQWPQAQRDRSLPATSAPRTRWIAVILAWSIGAGLLGWGIGRFAPHGRTVDQAFAEIWGPWLADPAGALICFSSPMTAGLRQVEIPYPPDSPTRGIEITPAEAERFEHELGLPSGRQIYLYPNIAHAKMGEALGSLSFAVQFTRAGVPVKATQSRFLNWQTFRNENLILLGHDEANKWLDPFLSKLPLRLAPTQKDKPRRIVNVNPQAGELPEYYARLLPGSYESSAEDFALVSILSGIDGKHLLALINGVNTEGTQTALEYMTDPAGLRNLVSALHKAAPNHKGPWHFQAVLRSDLRDRLPTRTELIALRILPQN
jgi:hypothetical protein